MKVKIRKYYSFPTMPNWVYNIANLRNAWWCVQEFVEDFFEKRRVSVNIDPWDTWSMDHELAEIVLPMLVQLKRTKQGAPYVDLKDVPKELQPKKQTKKQKSNGETDSTHFERWDWVLDEMIYSFNCKVSEDDVWMRFADMEQVKKEQQRISNGFRLFGKYYEALWD